nr:AbiV family abortive infection protein [Micrococcus luteus]
MGEPQVEEVSADFARRWWKSLMANAVALVEDAHALADRGSAGRAQALLVLAMEEVAKARWLYEAAEWEWSAPLGLYGVQPHEPGLVRVPDGLRTTAHHMQKSCRWRSSLRQVWVASGTQTVRRVCREFG